MIRNKTLVFFAKALNRILFTTVKYYTTSYSLTCHAAEVRFEKISDQFV